MRTAGSTGRCSKVRPSRSEPIGSIFTSVNIFVPTASSLPIRRSSTWWRSASASPSGRIITCRCWWRPTATRPTAAVDGRFYPDAVLLEPGLQLGPAVLRLIRAVARAVVGVKAVRRVGIEHDFARVVRRLERRLHFFDARNRNARVGAAVEAENRAFEFADEVDRVLRLQVGGRTLQAPVPRDRRLEVGVMRGVEPH